MLTRLQVLNVFNWARDAARLWASPVKMTSAPPRVRVMPQPPLRLLNPPLPPIRPPARAVSLNFPGTPSHPFQIGLELNLPCLVSLHASEPDA